VGENPKYRVALADVPVITVKPSNPRNTAPFEARIIHGWETGFMHAVRAPGYHTEPHAHPSEQFNYIVEGEIWFFVEEHGYRCKAGDVMRIPRDKVHWAWNRGPGSATVIETHSPPITANNQNLEKIVSLLGPDEDPSRRTVTTNVFPQFDQDAVDRIEERALAEETEQAR
jgi:quercetin dioxygenase-like cupin family protein